ncbi:hypothetical protein F4813DRAFT_376350 [Daldinia decipiens]|uniref:uncharacterized protein n=1 Tax=Daldinia decipiens TaxID=326647 RepID=UPI0020C37409|nr:uncharacterized protein F4813DRAFT_376350 [Daldinia decipiens]KAI1652924.1 hypothetical protein F4813DRAFT_376350 [Daldinia decipiens]
MKFINVLFLAASVSAVAIDRMHVGSARSTDLEEASSLLARHHAGRPANSQGNGNENGKASKAKQGSNSNAGAATGNTNNGAATGVAAGNTLVLKEVNGVPGNECLTFRNNGEIVDAACVNTAADRQITPTTLNGNSVLSVQRSFTAGFRPDLVGVNACVGFNGTHFRAEDCAAPNIELVQFDGTALRAPSGACAQGHDGAAQMVVDTTGVSCATFQSTTVTPTSP